MGRHATSTLPIDFRGGGGGEDIRCVKSVVKGPHRVFSRAHVIPWVKFHMYLRFLSQ